MFSIGEFARLGDISIRMLRHYDQIGLLPPARVDAVTGYRAYSIAQLRDLNRIIALRELGFTLAEVRQMISGTTAAELQRLLLLRRAEIERQLETSRSSLARVEARLRSIEREDELPDDIILKTAPTQRLLAVERTIPGFGPRNIAPVLNPAQDELAGVVRDMGLDEARTYLSCYDVSPDGVVTMYVGTPITDEIVDARQPGVIVILPGVEVASCVRQGTAREVWPRIVNDVMGWIEAHGYEHVGPGRDFFLEPNDADPSKQVFEIQAPLRRPGDPVPDVAPRRLSTDRAATSA